MIGRPLIPPDELKSMPKGQFIVMKTGFEKSIIQTGRWRMDILPNVMPAGGQSLQRQRRT